MPDNFQITEKISVNSVLAHLDRYWGLNETTAQKAWSYHKCANASKLPQDIAAVCAFLSDRDKVIAGLKPLETALEFRLQSMAGLKQQIEATRGQARADLFHFKTQKLLSSVLEDEEQRNGFNGATSTLRKLHTEAEYAGGPLSRVQFDPATSRPNALSKYNPGNKELKDLKPISLPKGAPTLTGLIVKSFNPILLKNGYHWKDPGAGDSHGEYTHRLQWYVLTQAWNKTLTAANSAYEVFTAMGFLAAGGGNPSKQAKDDMEQAMRAATSDADRQLIQKNANVTPVYLWEMVCDCFRTGTDEANSGKPWANTFNCPDVFNAYLSNPVYGKQHEYPVLHALMRARQGKRTREGDAWLDKIVTNKKDYKFAVTSKKDYGNIVWHRPPEQ